MKKINFKQPKYILPLFALPLFFTLFYAFGGKKEEVQNNVVVVEDGLQSNLSSPTGVENKNLSDKVEEYKRFFTDSRDNSSAIESLTEEEYGTNGDTLDDMDQALNNPYLNPSTPINQGYQPAPTQTANPSGYQPKEDVDSNQELLLELLKRNDQPHTDYEVEEDDPIEMLQKQFNLIDSFTRTQDPEYQQELKRQELEKQLQTKRQAIKDKQLAVSKASRTQGVFNTIKREEDEGFIKAILDESLTAYAGSRIRIKLLEDIQVGEENLIEKGTYLYATVTGFSAQRINFTIHSIMKKGKLLPVNLEIYDVDGLQGLYIPESAFREFTQELGSNSMQGFNLTTESSQSSAQFLLSSAQRAFQSTSQAIAKAIRKNKANLKYSTFIYLIEKSN